MNAVLPRQAFQTSHAAPNSTIQSSRGRQFEEVKDQIFSKTRRLRTLEERQAFQGVSLDPSTVLEIQDLKEELASLTEFYVQQGGIITPDLTGELRHVDKLKENFQRRLQGLKEKEASLGIYTDPGTIFEIGDIEAKLAELQRERDPLLDKLNRLQES